jgi:hypothetical protein
MCGRDFIPCLKKFSAIKVVEGYPRFVFDRNRITGGRFLRSRRGAEAGGIPQQLRGRSTGPANHPVLSAAVRDQRHPPPGECSLDSLPSGIVAGIVQDGVSAQYSTSDFERLSRSECERARRWSRRRDSTP